MKRRYFIVAAGSLATTLPSRGASLKPEPRPVCYIFAGESNSRGLALNADLSSQCLRKQRSLAILNNDTLRFEPLEIGKNNNLGPPVAPPYGSLRSHGWEAGLATILGQNNKHAYLIKGGQGGSKVAEWAHGSIYLDKLAQRIAAAKVYFDRRGQRPIWKVWISIGINDFAQGTLPAAYALGLQSMLWDINCLGPIESAALTIFPATGLPQMASEFYNQKIRTISSLNPRIKAVKTFASDLMPDGYHWNTAGMAQMAKSLYNATES
jgi:lysophospholipase L1-like esterase